MSTVHLVLTVVVLALGAAVAYVVAVLGRPSRGQEPSMVWEARVAAGFAGLVVGVPLLVAQVVVTLLAGGGWLWLGLPAAPAVGLLVAQVRQGRPTR